MPLSDMERWPRSAVAFAIADGWQKIRQADDKLAAHAACSTLVNELGEALPPSAMATGRCCCCQRATLLHVGSSSVCILMGRCAGARVQRQRSRADATSMLVSQSQQARKRQKRAEAAEARRVGEQLMFVDRLPLSPVKNSAL